MIDRAPSDLRRQEMLGDDRKIGRRYHPAIEADHRRRDSEGPEQHAQAARRPALVIEKRIPLARNAATAAWARDVRILSSVTNVPSTSEITAEHLNGNARARLMTIVHRHRRRCSASVGHLAPEVHPLRSVLSLPLDRSADRPRHPWPKRRAPAARRARRAPPCRRA